MARSSSLFYSTALFLFATPHFCSPPRVFAEPLSATAGPGSEAATSSPALQMCSTIAISSVSAIQPEIEDDLCISEEAPFSFDETAGSAEGSADALSVATAPLGGENPAGRKCALFIYTDYPECSTVQFNGDEDPVNFIDRCARTPVVVDPFTQKTALDQCSAPFDIDFGVQSPESLDCRSRYLSEAEHAAQQIQDPEVATKYPALAIFKDYFPVIIKRGTDYARIAELLKQNHCASPSRQVFFGAGHGADTLSSRCLNAMKIGVIRTTDLASNTFQDRRAMMDTLKGIQRELEPGQGLAVTAQQVNTCSLALTGSGGQYDSAIQCTVNPDAIRCIPSFCNNGNPCFAGSTDSVLPICTVDGGQNKPNSLGCKECVDSGRRTVTGEKYYVWSTVAPQADGSISPRCGSIPPEFEPAGS